ncbi:FecR family protein [Flavobacterium rhizosphaerae]|uniref:FecR domain-containing protein n=1 Tax=Flavobacterium rhizosphaerae TaxID=3163298 RepID=A0ABW8YZA3_9FLAO
MDKDQFKELAGKYAKGTCSAEEKKAVEAFFEQMQHKEVYLHNDPARRDKILKGIYSHINSTRRKTGFAKMLKIAAAIVLLLGAGLFTALYNNKVPMVKQFAARGEKKEVTLKDGSVIVLNSGSSITYPEVFGNTRNVTLTGEAYFKVFRNPSKPFIVSTHNATIKVLGTSFNINSFKQHTTHVSVLTGKVEVSAPSGQKVILVKNQQAAYTDNNGFIRTGADSNEGIAWTRNIIALNNATLAETAKILENWYDAEIELQGAGLGSLTITGKFKDEKLDSVLESIAYVKHLEVTYVTPKKIIIRKKAT